jgi:hypothetical protein
MNPMSAAFLAISVSVPFGIRAGESQQAGQPDGDAGDPYNGYDRFGRTVDIHWSKPIG